MIQTIEVPVDVAMTAKCVGGRFVAARPDRRSDSLFTRHGGDAAVKDGVATISALKAGLALHFRRQVNEMHENYRAALNDIPRYAEVMEADGFLIDYQPPEEDAEETPPTGTCQNIYNKIIGAWNGINGTCWTTLCKCLGDSPYAAVAEEPDQAPAGAKVHIKDHGVYDARLKKDIDEHFNSELNRLRSDLEQALMRLSQPAAEATWQTTEELEELAFAIVRMKSLIGGCVISGFQSSGKFLPELVWNSIMPGVRTSFQPIAIDLTPIDTQLHSAITSKHGGDRFPGDGSLSFYERAQQLLAEKNHLRANGTSSAAEMQQIVQMLESQGVQTERVTLHANPMSVSGRGRGGRRGGGRGRGSGRGGGASPAGSFAKLQHKKDRLAARMEAKHGADLSEAGKRISPEDGIAYTRKEFIEYFGGEVEWDAASPEDFDAAVFF